MGYCQTFFFAKLAKQVIIERKAREKRGMKMGVLEGLRILDMSRLLPGPYCTRMLADMGAEVIKIEEPVRGDYSREFVPRRKDFSCWFMEVNRNKKSVALDLKLPEAKKQFLELVKTAAVVVESYRPGVLKKLGVDYATAKKVNPQIVYCSITGYGQKGPFHKDADHDMGYAALAGVVSMSGTKDGAPAIPGFPLVDMHASALAGMAILGAVRHAEKTGEGQEIQLSLFDTALDLMPGVAAAYFGDGTIHERGNNWLTGTRPNYNIYETKDHKYLTVACLEAKFWNNLCRVIGKPEWEKLIAKPENNPKLIQGLQEVFRQKTMQKWIELFAGQDACVRPVLNFAEAVALPQAIEDDMVLTVKDPELGTYHQMGFPIKFSKTPCAYKKRAPRLGENTDEILHDLKKSKQ
jgi:crotonobetainyl-CoA:carnitine CoA-transferase CaiB-like acyl-CoA transferase